MVGVSLSVTLLCSDRTGRPRWGLALRGMVVGVSLSVTLLWNQDHAI